MEETAVLFTGHWPRLFYWFVLDYEHRGEKASWGNVTSPDVLSPVGLKCGQLMKRLRGEERDLHPWPVATSLPHRTPQEVFPLLQAAFPWWQSKHKLWSTVLHYKLTAQGHGLLPMLTLQEPLPWPRGVFPGSRARALVLNEVLVKLC